MVRPGSSGIVGSEEGLHTHCRGSTAGASGRLAAQPPRHNAAGTARLHDLVDRPFADTVRQARDCNIILRVAVTVHSLHQELHPHPQSAKQRHADAVATTSLVQHDQEVPQQRLERQNANRVHGQRLPSTNGFHRGGEQLLRVLRGITTAVTVIKRRCGRGLATHVRTDVLLSDTGRLGDDVQHVPQQCSHSRPRIVVTAWTTKSRQPHRS